MPPTFFEGARSSNFFLSLYLSLLLQLLVNLGGNRLLQGEK